MRAAVVLVVLALAGCVAEPAETAVLPANATEPEVVAPREIAAFRETNATEEGLGGEAHSHDYWKGRDRVDLFVDDVQIAPLPILTGGLRSYSVEQTLPPPNLVYEGTSHVEFLVGGASATGYDPYPVPALRLEYRTAADGPLDWRDGGALVAGTPTAVPVLPHETDMPHSVASLWVFRLVGDGPHVTNVNLTVTAVRGADVPPWPGHPEFYAGRSSRVVFEGDASNREIGIAARYVLFGGERDWRFPERVISWGTGRVDVFVNVTRVEAPVPPDSAYLRVRNATQVFDDFTVLYDVEGRDDLESYHFQMPVDVAGMDSPYAPSSRWAFSLAVGYADGNGAVFPSTVDYRMTIVASKAEDPAAAKGAEE